jgi:hypothetical protein
VTVGLKEIKIKENFPIELFTEKPLEQSTENKTNIINKSQVFHS